MSRQDQQILAGLRQLCHQPYELHSGTVVPGSVDTKSYTISVLLTGNNTPIDNVMLQPVIKSGNGCIAIPADGSDVIIASIDGPGRYFMICATTLAKCILKIGDQSLVLDNNGIVINEGKNGGLPITASIVSRLNKIEQDINTLKQLISNWQPVANDGGTALKTTLAKWMTQSLQTTTDGDIENKKITQ